MPRTTQRFLPLLFLLFLATASVSGAPDQLTVVAERGDGIYSLLRRYRLVEYPCNITEFMRLNRLNNNSQLFVGRSYKLPVEVYSYNGESIRTTTGNDNFDRALAIQYYNEDLLVVGVRSTDFRKDKLLYVPHHIDACMADFDAENAAKLASSGELSTVTAIESPPGPAPEQSTTSAYRTFDLFGPTHAYVPLVDNKLAGRIFYVVAGHGGPDPGAVGKRNGHSLYEDEYAYDVALRLTRNILAHGGTPYMIVRDENDGIRDEEYLKGDKDETVWGGASLPRNQKERLFQRSDIINQLYDENLAKGITDQTMISIHIDSRQKGKRIDLFFYHYYNDLIGAKQAERIHQTIGAKYDQYRPGRGYEGTVGPRDLHMLRETKPSGVYIELANITNSSDQQRIIMPTNRQLMADWILLGLLR